MAYTIGAEWYGIYYRGCIGEGKWKPTPPSGCVSENSLHVKFQNKYCEAISVKLSEFFIFECLFSNVLLTESLAIANILPSFKMLKVLPLGVVCIFDIRAGYRFDSVLIHKLTIWYNPIWCDSDSISIGMRYEILCICSSHKLNESVMGRTVNNMT